MAIVLLLARLLLALIFAVAGMAKAINLAATRKALAGFGVPEKLAQPLGSGLPFVELLVSLALLPVATAWLGAIAALTLVVIFAAAIGVNLSRGQKPDCNCFGQLHSRPVSWSLFNRNLVLAALAALVVVEGAWGNNGLSLGDLGAQASSLLGLRPIELGGLGLGVVGVALLGGAVLYLRRMLKQQTTILERIDAMKRVIDEDYAEPAALERKEAALVQGLPVGALAPEFSLASIGGDRVTLQDLLGYGKSVLLLFVSPNCSPCKTILSTAAAWQLDHRSDFTVAIISKGDLEENRKTVTEYRVRQLLLQAESGVADDYEAKWTPAAVLINRNGRIASPVVYGDEEIRALVARSIKTADSHRKRSLPVTGNGHNPQLIIGTPHALDYLGELAPKFSLPDADGEFVESEDLLDRDTLLLFWDPKCPFCKTMSEDINRWEDDPPKRAPRLVFVSSGDAEEVKAESGRFKSRFLCDTDFRVGLLFGTNLTPSAVLVDARGRIASAPTAGRAQILALAGVRKVDVPIASGLDSYSSRASIM